MTTKRRRKQKSTKQNGAIDFVFLKPQTAIGDHSRMSTTRPSTWQADTASAKKSVSQSDYIMLSMVPNSSKPIVLLILSALASNLSCAPVFADDKEAVSRMFGQYSGQSFRDSFFSEQLRQGSSMDELAELERKLSEERAEKKELRRLRDAIEEKDKLERAERNKHIFDRSEDQPNSLGASYSTPILDNDFSFNFEKQVLPPDLFSARDQGSNFDYAKARDPDLAGPDDFDWLQVMRSNSGLFPRAREVEADEKGRLDSDSSARRNERAKLPGRVIEVTGDWVPDKLDPINNGGFTIAPDNGSPVPYKLNGHVDIQRGRPWNDND
ncbi:MAG: hypothetical protein WC714_02750 [Candidatus Obscuribacterales bacterium]